MEHHYTPGCCACTACAACTCGLLACQQRRPQALYSCDPMCCDTQPCSLLLNAGSYGICHAWPIITYQHSPPQLMCVFELACLTHMDVMLFHAGAVGTPIWFGFAELGGCLLRASVYTRPRLLPVGSKPSTSIDKHDAPAIMEGRCVCCSSWCNFPFTAVTCSGTACMAVTWGSKVCGHAVWFGASAAKKQPPALPRLHLGKPQHGVARGFQRTVAAPVAGAALCYMMLPAHPWLPSVQVWVMPILGSQVSRQLSL